MKLINKMQINEEIMFDKNAIINLNKPTGMSSFFAVKKVARLLGVKKAGHMGTLDPLGTGVLLVGVNKGTKLFDEYLKKIKTYIAVFHFGYETDTLDSEGSIIKSCEVDISRHQIEKILPSFLGKQNQMPPAFSAKKINGQKACDLARKGKAVELKPKEIEIYNIRLLREFSYNNFQFEITCSSGTYIRSICRDLAGALSTCGTMLSIIRTKCGGFSIDNSCTLHDIEQGKISYLEL